MDLHPIEKHTYKCPECYEHYEDRHRAYECIFKHSKENLANAMLEDGRDLQSINYLCGFGWELSDKQKTITKDNCFTISYLQSCDKPAYRISNIDKYGKITVFGKGSWSGYYSSVIRMDNLNDPRPPEELFEHSGSV